MKQVACQRRSSCIVEIVEQAQRAARAAGNRVRPPSQERRSGSIQITATSRGRDEDRARNAGPCGSGVRGVRRRVRRTLRSASGCSRSTPRPRERGERSWRATASRPKRPEQRLGRGSRRASSVELADVEAASSAADAVMVCLRGASRRLVTSFRPDGSRSPLRRAGGPCPNRYLLPGQGGPSCRRLSPTSLDGFVSRHRSRRKQVSPISLVRNRCPRACNLGWWI